MKVIIIRKKNNTDGSSAGKGEKYHANSGISNPPSWKMR